MVPVDSVVLAPGLPSGGGVVLAPDLPSGGSGVALVSIGETTRAVPDSVLVDGRSPFSEVSICAVLAPLLLGC